MIAPSPLRFARHLSPASRGRGNRHIAMTTFMPSSQTDVLDAVKLGAVGGRAAGNFRPRLARGIGRPMQCEHALDLSSLSGVTLYEPEELVLSAKAGTPLIDIERLLAKHRQELAFEPMNCTPAVRRHGHPDRQDRHDRRRARHQSRRAAPAQGRRGARPCARHQRRVRPRRSCSSRADASSRTSPATTSPS